MPKADLDLVLKRCNQLVADAGGSLVTQEHLLTIVAACAANPDAAHALRILLDDAARIAARTEQRPRVAATSQGLERLLCDTLDAVVPAK